MIFTEEPTSAYAPKRIKSDLGLGASRSSSPAKISSIQCASLLDLTIEFAQVRHVPYSTRLRVPEDVLEDDRALGKRRIDFQIPDHPKQYEYAECDVKSISLGEVINPRITGLPDENEGALQTRISGPTKSQTLSVMMRTLRSMYLHCLDPLSAKRYTRSC